MLSQTLIVILTTAVAQESAIASHAGGPGFILGWEKCFGCCSTKRHARTF